MAYDVYYSDTALKQLKNLRALDRSAIFAQVDEVLCVNPTLPSKSRVKRLRQPAPTQYRLRVGDFRVYYDVDGQAVNVIQILSKEDSISYLEE